jgi:drug/metabolite transporter (DMT)-like permease
LDPLIAVILSALLLREDIGLWGIVGTVLILGSALYSELPERKKS